MRLHPFHLFLHQIVQPHFLMGNFTQKSKFNLYPLTSLPMESICIPQNISGALQQISVAAFFQATKVDGDLF